MSYLQVANNAYSTLAAGITDSDIELTVATGEGDRFPETNFHITIDDEILKCSSHSGDVFTVVRAQEDTVAATHDLNAAVRLNITKALIDEIHSALESGPEAHASSHESGGADEINVAGMSGELADDQPPKAHASNHTDGTDDIQDAASGQKGLATAAQIAKLDGIEVGATVDQTGAEIKALYEAEDDTNAFTDAEKTKLAGVEDAADVTDADNVGSSIDGASAKTTPVDADTQSLIDSAAGNALKKVTWANIKATLKSYFDTLYEALGDIAAHAALDTGVHGAGGDTLATDADIAAHEADLDAHHCFEGLLLKSGYYLLPYSGGTYANADMYQYTMHSCCVRLPVSRSFDGIVIEIDTVDSGKDVRLGLYEDNNGIPGNLIVDAGLVDTDTTAVKLASISQTLQPGYYWLVAITDSNNVAKAVGIWNPTTGLGGVSSNFGSGTSHAVTSVSSSEFAALPDPHPTPDDYEHFGPLIALRAA